MTYLWATNISPRICEAKTFPCPPTPPMMTLKGSFEINMLSLLLPDRRSRTDLAADSATRADGLINVCLSGLPIPHQSRTLEDARTEPVATAGLTQAALLFN